LKATAKNSGDVKGAVFFTKPKPLPKNARNSARKTMLAALK